MATLPTIEYESGNKGTLATRVWSPLVGTDADDEADVFLTKWAESGTTRQRAWSRQFGTAADDRLNDIALHDGAIYLGG